MSCHTTFNNLHHTKRGILLTKASSPRPLACPDKASRGSGLFVTTFELLCPKPSLGVRPSPRRQGLRSRPGPAPAVHRGGGGAGPVRRQHRVLAPLHAPPHAHRRHHANRGGCRTLPRVGLDFLTLPEIALRLRLRRNLPSDTFTHHDVAWHVYVMYAYRFYLV